MYKILKVYKIYSLILGLAVAISGLGFGGFGFAEEAQELLPDQNTNILDEMSLPTYCGTPSREEDITSREVPAPPEEQLKCGDQRLTPYSICLEQCNSGCGGGCNTECHKQNEICDGKNSGDESCKSLGYAGGQLGCYSCTSFDVSQCQFCNSSATCQTQDSDLIPWTYPESAIARSSWIGKKSVTFAVAWSAAEPRPRTSPNVILVLVNFQQGVQKAKVTVKRFENGGFPDLKVQKNRLILHYGFAGPIGTPTEINLFTKIELDRTGKVLKKQTGSLPFMKMTQSNWEREKTPLLTFGEGFFPLAKFEMKKKKINVGVLVYRLLQRKNQLDWDAPYTKPYRTPKVVVAVSK